MKRSLSSRRVLHTRSVPSSAECSVVLLVCYAKHPWVFCGVSSAVLNQAARKLWLRPTLAQCVYSERRRVLWMASKSHPLLTVMPVLAPFVVLAVARASVLHLRSTASRCRTAK